MAADDTSSKPANPYVIELTSPFTDDDDRAMRAYYDQRAAEYDEWYLRRGLFAMREDRERWDAELRALAERVRGFGAGRLLEIACGTGWWTRHLACRARVVALDYSAAMLGVTRERLRAAGLAARLIRADAYALPLPPNSFDSCFIGCWMSHVPYVRLPDFLAGVRKVLTRSAAVMVIDTAPPPGENRPEPGAEYYNPRKLNDGSHHRVLKIDHNTATLASALAPLGRVVETWNTGRHFVGAVIEVV